MKFSTTLLYSLLLALSLLACSAGNGEQEYITIGALLPLTGYDSEQGLRAMNGLQLAKQEINDNGGIMGKKLDIIVLNDKGNNDFALYQYNILKEKGIKALIGSSSKSVTMVLMKAATADGIPIFSPSNENLTYNDQDKKIIEFKKNYFHVFSQMPYPCSSAAYLCVYILTDSLNTLEN